MVLSRGTPHQLPCASAPFQVLDKKGFQMFYTHQNTQCKYITLGNSDCSIRHCMEFGFIRKVNG